MDLCRQVQQDAQAGLIAGSLLAADLADQLRREPIAAGLRLIETFERTAHALLGDDPEGAGAGAAAARAAAYQAQAEAIEAAAIADLHHKHIFRDYLGPQPSKYVNRLPFWREDGRCSAQQLCNPYTGNRCCNLHSGWCGSGADFCECGPACVVSKKFEEDKSLAWTDGTFSPHVGYVNILPYALIFAAKGERFEEFAKIVSKLWSKHGLMSLAASSPFFRKGEDYWRGKIWMNLNFLTLSALRQYEPLLPAGGEAAAKCAKLYAELRAALLATVERNFEARRSVFENYDPKTGAGTGTQPFTGWTALVAMIQSETFLARVGDGGAVRGEDSDELE